jgi:hypothetical protein
VSAFTLDQFWAADGYQRIRRAVSRLKTTAITGTTTEELAHDAVVCVIDRFDRIMAKCPTDRDPGAHVVGAALFYARDAARNKNNGYHECEKKAARPIYGPDEPEEAEAFESLLGQALPKVYTGDLFASLSPNIRDFAYALCRQRYDLFGDFVAALENVKNIDHNKRKQLRYAYDAWTHSPKGRIPNPQKVSPIAVPDDVMRLPQDAEVLGLLEDGWMDWTSPELVANNKTRTVNWEVDWVQTDEDGNDMFLPVIESVELPDDHRYSPIYVLAA